MHKILLIEDNLGDMFLFNEYIKEKMNCFNIKSCTSLESGIKKLAKDRFDAILLDLHLPDSNGVDTINKVHEYSNNTPIIVFTHSDDMLDEIARMNVDDYIIKGQYDSDMLVKRIEFSIAKKKHSRV